MASAALGRQGLLRFMTCGSVDDGKSTLIGRLLHDASLIPSDQLEMLEAESRKHGTVADGMDLSLLLDGLAAEHEQRITVDVAYRYFSTPRRRFMVADAPGHEQYTRNMATAASLSELAVVLADARQGVLAQTRRHTIICGLLGIRHVVLAVNKMDLAAFDRARFAEIEAEYCGMARAAGTGHMHCIPVSALLGDNVVRRSSRMPWYSGPSLLEYLEEVEAGAATESGQFRFPVQWVCRPHPDFRGYAGTVHAGTVRRGDRALVLPSRHPTHIARIVTANGEPEAAGPGTAVVLTLADEIDVTRGDMIVAAADPPEVADQAVAHLINLSDAPLLPGRSYTVMCGPQTVTGSITSLKHKINIDNLDHLAARSLDRNEIGYCSLAFQRPLVFDRYETSRETGSLILLDKATNATLAAGMLELGLRRASNLRWQAFDVDRTIRAELKHQTPCCLWFTGLAGSGKSTLANLLEKRLVALGRHTYVLDGDNVRHGLSRDLGFTDADRVENIRRVAETARLMVDAGLIVMVALISPFRAERQMAREMFEEGQLLELYVDTPLDVCEARDPKGLYRKARAGQLVNFTGIDSPYEPPQRPELQLAAGTSSPGDLVQQIVDELARRELI